MSQAIKRAHNHLFGKYAIAGLLALAMTIMPMVPPAHAQECRTHVDLSSVATISSSLQPDGSFVVKVSLNTFSYYYVCSVSGCSPFPDGVSFDWMTNVSNFVSNNGSCSTIYNFTVTPTDPSQPIGLGVRILFHFVGSGALGKAHGPVYIP